jgi:2-amino-4-hydroxy-6-hydroxymethyldihydropteridine diphosphokinase
MNKACLLLGSNLGDSQFLFLQAQEQLIAAGVKPMQRSSLYQSPPWGFEHENDFLNQVILLETRLSPLELLDVCLTVEEKLGRRRQGQGYAARTIDIDILFFNEEVIAEERLTVPHPRLHERRFTLLPLVELMPGYVHPLLKKNIGALLNECADDSQVEKR